MQVDSIEDANTRLQMCPPLLEGKAAADEAKILLLNERFNVANNRDQILVLCKHVPTYILRFGAPMVTLQAMVMQILDFR